MIQGLDKKVKTVILLMFENRSFDHMLGHLSLQGINPNVNGLNVPLTQDHYRNIFNGKAYFPYPLYGLVPLTCDIPHEYDFVKTQLNWNPIQEKFLMDGFVKAYAKSSETEPVVEAEPMGYFTADQVPITSFLARNFCTCDNWFCSIPTSTQPNRTLAFTGDSSIHLPGIQNISIKNNLFHWLNEAKINWKVYHDYISFFILYPGLWDHMLGDKFCNYKNFHNDWQSQRDDSDPRLIIIEPTYHDCPHINKQPNDNHAPLSVGWGEEFLRGVYETVISNKDKWGETVMIVYYDEHGGFFDHVPPPLLPYKTTGEVGYQFDSLGPRIPGIIVSPFVEKGSVCNSLFDHTSVLQFLSEIFTSGTPYSENVELRKKNNIKSISDALTNDISWEPPQAPTQAINAHSIIGETIAKTPGPNESMRQAFEAASQDIMQQRSVDVKRKYPQLLQWKNAVEKRRTNHTL